MLDALPPSPGTTQTIVVTGRALPEPISERTLQVEILGNDSLKNSPAHKLDEILKQVAGLQYFRRSDSTSGHPTSQGVTIRALGGNASSRALLVLDGVPQADPFGGWVNWPAYDAAGLEEVRVVRGGGSVSYGPGALAGVIEMRSLNAVATETALETGSRRSLRGHAYFGRKVADGILTIDTEAARSEGFVPVTEPSRGAADERAPYREGSIRARWVIPIDRSVEVQLGGLAFADQRSRGIPFTANRTRGADASVRFVGRSRWQWSALAYAQWRNLRSSFASIDELRETASRVALQDSVPSTGRGFSFELRPPIGHNVDVRFGADGRAVRGESRELYGYTDGEPTRRRVAGGKSLSAGIFVDATVSRGALTVNGAFRIDRWRISNGMMREALLASGTATRDETYGSRSGWRHSARIGVLLDLGHGVGVRAAAYQAWRLPTLNELFRPFRAGADATAANPLLEPERLSGVEAGARLQRGTMDASLTVFSNRLSNPIANVTLGHGPGIFPGVGFVAGDYRQRQNLEAIRVRGLEASGQARHGPWSVRLGASFTDAKVVGEGASAALDGLQPAQTPEWLLSGSVGWSSNDRSVSLEVRRVGSQFDDDLNRIRLPGATTLNAFASWPISERLQIVARAQNLLNKTVVAAVNDDESIERATPRTFWIGFRFSRR